ncbi:hypothetical protein RB195_003786 [Necator americanus]|uniref:MIZ/SP-RING zinc finger n=2 Tax=Necator americanus TaxID=51031 RepID=A0ABR1DSU9_NECAM
MNEDISYEEHVQQNNQRLISIKMSLMEGNTFPSACSELTQWCGDQRAFSSYFEENLLAALQVAVENGTKDGFDFALAHQLISACFAHRKLLSKDSATRINRWYEQFRRLKKSGGKRKKKSDSSESATPLLRDRNIEEVKVSESGQMWPSAGPMLQSPSYPPGPAPSAMIQTLPGYGMQPSPYPMDPAGARPQQYPSVSDQNVGVYDQNAINYNQQQQRMIMMHQQQQMQQVQAHARSRRGPSVPMPQQPGQPFDPMYQGVPMGVNNVPGQAQPLMRYPQGAMTSPSYPMPTNGRPSGVMTSPGYPQMYRAGAPVLYGQVQQQAQHQQVISYPNPNAPPDGRYNVPYISDGVPPVIVPKEVILRPFGLEHNMNHHTFTFNLRPEIMQQLQSPFIDIQLKSFHKDDKKMTTQWPPKQASNGQSVPGTLPECSIQVLINGQIVPIPDLGRSLFIKQVVISGPNTIEFTVNQCVCSHSFIMQLVVRQPLAKITQDIFNRTQCCTMEMCREKMLKLTPPTGLRVPLVCDVTHRRMSIPARSSRCVHAACFDLEPFIMQQNENSLYECHLCKTIFQLNEIDLDYFVGKMLRETTGNQAAEMLLEPNGEYRPVEQELSGRKRQNDENGPAHPIKRIKSEPFSATVAPPSVMSPFPPPPSSAPIGTAPSMMSPFAASQSPIKAVSSPAGARFTGGPGTPSTPLAPQNPASVGAAPTAGSLSSEPVIHSTSPHQTQIQQHGSVEAPSLTGSAPYTPASVNSGVALPTVNSADQPFANVHNLSLSSIDIEIDGKSLFTSALMTADDIKKYLNDSDNVFSAFDDLTCTNDAPSFGGFPHCWEDIQSIIAADEKRG